jgi:DNA-binding MarR family transcriptional regulator
VTLVLWDLNRTDYAVLNMLRSMGSPYKLRPTDLKVRLLLTSGGVTCVLKRLEQRGFVERGQDTTDVRSCWVRLTEVGIETAGAITQSWSQAESQFFSSVAPEAVQAASDALREVLIAIGDVPRKRYGHTRSSHPGRTST